MELRMEDLIISGLKYHILTVDYFFVSAETVSISVQFVID